MKSEVVESPPWVWCDFGKVADGRVRLDSPRTQEDLAQGQIELRLGLRLLLWQEDEWYLPERRIEVSYGTVQQDEDGTWACEVDLLTIRSLDGHVSPEEAVRAEVAPHRALDLRTRYVDPEHAEVLFNTDRGSGSKAQSAKVERHQGLWYVHLERLGLEGFTIPFFSSRLDAALHLVSLLVAIALVAVTVGNWSVPPGAVELPPALVGLLQLAGCYLVIYLATIAMRLKEEWHYKSAMWFYLFVWGIATYVSFFRLFGPMRYWEAGRVLGWGKRVRVALLGASAALVVLAFNLGNGSLGH